MAEVQPTLRERQTRQVAREIRLAFIRLVNSKGPNGFALRDVATEAGVSERTLYRYYPGRDELIEAIRVNENAAMEKRLGTLRARLADLSDPDTIARVFEVFEEHTDLVTAADLLRLSGIDQSASAARTDEIRHVLSESAGIVEEVVPQLAGLIRTICSSAGWMRMTGPDVGLDSREAGFAAQWAIEVLLDAARDQTGPLRPKGRTP